MKCYRIRVIGKVQGVFFRVSTKEKAISIGISGWVKNEPDGSVLMEVEGAEREIETFKKWCYSGPQSAKVDTVEVEEITTQGFLDFTIRY